MKFNLFFLSYSVIYAKYNYCYDVPNDIPTRYFDGKEWKIIKTRHQVRTKAPKPLNILSKELDWADLIKEMKEIELIEPPPEIYESTCVVKETTASKNSVTKMAAAPQLTIKKRPTQSTTIKTTVNHSPNNIYKLKFTTTTTEYPDREQKKNIEKLKDWKNMWNFIRPTVIPSSVTTQKYFVQTTKKCPAIRLTKQLATTNSPAKLSGAQGDGGYVSENWSNLLKEFLKFVALKKCEPPCKPDDTNSDNLYLLTNNRRPMTHDDDLMNILTDGVQIDDRLSEDDYLTSQRELEPSKEKLEDQSQILDFESKEGSTIDYENEFSGDNELDGDVKSNEIAVRATKKQHKTAQSRKKIAYLDKLHDKCTKISDEIVKSSEIKSYFEALHEKHVKRENELSEEKGMKASLDEENYSHSRKEQDKDLRKHINDKDLYGQNDADNLINFSQDTLNSKDINDDSTEIKSQTNDEDVYQDRDITFEVDALEGDDVGADKYSTERSLGQGGEFTKKQ